MARTSTAEKPNTDSGSGATDPVSTSFSAGAHENQERHVDGVGAEANKPAKPRRPVGPKVVYVMLKDESVRDGILGIHTNPRDVMNTLENNPGSRTMKLTLPQRDKGDKVQVEEGGKEQAQV